MKVTSWQTSYGFSERDVTAGYVVWGTLATVLAFLVFAIFAIPDNSFWVRFAVAIGYTFVAQAAAMGVAFLLHAGVYAVNSARNCRVPRLSYDGILRSAAVISTYGALIFIYVRLSGAVL